MKITLAKRLTLSFLAAVLISGSVYFYFMLHGSRGRNLGSIVQKYAFTEIVPPTKLIGPGAIVTILNTNPFVVSVTCRAFDSLGSNSQGRVLSSESASSKQVAELTGSFTVDTALRDQFGASAHSKFVRTVTATLSDVKILEIPDSAVFDLLSDRTKGCAQAIRFRQDNGKMISMIKSVIQADVVYRVQFEGDVDATTRTKVTRGIAGDLGLTNGINSDDTVQGNGLIWGVRDDMSLASLVLSNAPNTAGVMHQRALPTSRSAKVVVDVP